MDNTASKVFLWGSMFTEAMSVIYDLRWMIVLIIVLILSDLWFGLKESIHKKEKIRFSHAGRRTCNKSVDYMTYLILGSVIGLAILEPLGIASHTISAAIGLGLGCMWEIESIIGHVCVLHGIKNRFSIRALVLTIIKKRNKQVGEALEEQFKNQESGKDS